MVSIVKEPCVDTANADYRERAFSGGRLSLATFATATDNSATNAGQDYIGSVAGETATLLLFADAVRADGRAQSNFTQT